MPRHRGLGAGYGGVLQTAGHGRWRGDVVAAETVATLFEGIADLGVLPSLDAVLSGYIGTAETGAMLLDIVGQVKAANPRAHSAAIR